MDKKKLKWYAILAAAAIAATLSEEFGRMPVFEVDAIGYGAGQREMETLNALRVIVGHESKKA